MNQSELALSVILTQQANVLEVQQECMRLQKQVKELEDQLESVEAKYRDLRDRKPTVVETVDGNAA